MGRMVTVVPQWSCHRLTYWRPAGDRDGFIVGASLFIGAR
jgi:hypothetical protein